MAEQIFLSTAVVLVQFTPNGSVNILSLLMENPPRMDKSSQTQDFELLTEIAIAYYCDEVTQEEIANRFGFSRIKIGRLLKRAKEEGIVEINVRYHPVFSTQLEKQMQERFPITRALIALDHNDEDEQRRQVAALVSNYLANNLRDNMVVTVGQGRIKLVVGIRIS